MIRGIPAFTLQWSKIYQNFAAKLLSLRKREGIRGNLCLETSLVLVEYVI